MRLAKDDKEDFNQDYHKGIEATARGFHREGETGLNSKQAGGDTAWNRVRWGNGWKITKEEASSMREILAKLTNRIHTEDRSQRS